MKIRKMFFIFLVFSISPIFAQSSNIPYWFLDVNITNRFLGTSSQQRAYFFKDLKSMEALTGFPRDDAPSGNNTSYKWSQPLYNIPPYVEQIFAVMRREGFEAAFVLTDSGTSIRGIPYWNYNLFLYKNGIGYFDIKTRYNNPVRF